MPDVTITFTRDEVINVMTTLARKAVGCETIKPKVEFRAEGGNASPFARVHVVFESGKPLASLAVESDVA